MAIYVTNSGLAGNVAAAQGFNISATGPGAKLYNVGGNGAVVGSTANLTYPVLALMQKANALAPWAPGVKRAVNYIADGMNQSGDRQ